MARSLDWVPVVAARAFQVVQPPGACRLIDLTCGGDAMES